MYIGAKIYNKQWYIDNKINILEKSKNYSLLNKDKINNRNKINYHKNPNIKLHKNTRKIIHQSLIKNKLLKTSRTIAILGCTIEDFKIYITNKFENWMDWNNYGNPKNGIYQINKNWDLDHIIPISTAKTLKEIIALNHYTNFQPMCSYKNRWIKSNKLN